MTQTLLTSDIINLNKGDILLVGNETYKPYIAYDKGLVIGCGVTGTYIKNLKLLRMDKGQEIIILSPKEEISPRRKRDVNDHLVQLMTGTVKLSIKTRLYFLKYIAWIYDNVMKYPAVEHPSIPATVPNLLSSQTLRVTRLKHN